MWTLQEKIEAPNDDHHPYAAMLALCLGALSGAIGSACLACVIVARRSPAWRAMVLEGLDR